MKSPGEVVDCRKPDSFFFDLIKPPMVDAAGDPQANSNPLHRVCSLMRKMKADSVIELVRMAERLKSRPA